MNGVEKRENIIKYRGIETNNLKHIDVDIEKNTLIAVVGPSGSGKSSLVYGTIYEISACEEDKLRNIYREDYNYKIETYENIIPAVELKQNNNNINPRSTLGIFLNIDKEFKKIFAGEHGVPVGRFTFNNPRNSCPRCGGLGEEYVLSLDKIIDENKSIEDGALRPWRNSQDGHYEKVLEKYCVQEGICKSIPYCGLSQEEKNKITYGRSSEKFRVSYKANGKTRTKEFYYVGILAYLEEYLEDKEQASSKEKIKSYSHMEKCSLCGGMRFNSEVLEYKIDGYSIGDFYTMEIEELCEYLKSKEKREFKKIYEILQRMVQYNLGYLNLNRSIPSLSGGELQRLRLMNILSSEMEDMLYIIDEPSAKLHVSEYEELWRNIQGIKERGNTVIIVEHNPYFIQRADRRIYIGPRGGSQGGYLLDRLEEKPWSWTRNFKEPCDYIEVKNISKNNIKNLTVKFPKNVVTAILGVSGSGKSTLVKELNERLENSEYISQKPLRGSSASTIGSYSEVYGLIRKEMSKKLQLDEKFFNFNCDHCGGKGKEIYIYDFGKEMEVQCAKCEGKRFNVETLEYKYRGYNIYEILNLTIEDLLEINIFENKGIRERLELLKKMGLGYLSLFRTTDTLSGGEAQRVKLSKVLGKRIKDKILFLDEPLNGLSQGDIEGVLKLFTELRDMGATVVLIEHNILALRGCDYILEMGPSRGKNGGKIIFEGTMEEFKGNNNYEKYKIK